MEATILRSKVYEHIHSGEPFDMEFVTCDRRRGTGGELIHAKAWMILTMPGEKPAAGAPGATKAQTASATKNPHHSDNGTVNIFNPANAGYHPISVHYDLIQFFNGKRVIN